MKFLVLLSLLYGFEFHVWGAEPGPPNSKIREVARSRYWQLLLHYRGKHSEADGPGFFLSPTGNSDPEAELEADLLAFQPGNTQRIGPLLQHPQCAFPGRFRYLQKELKGSNLSPVICKDFLQWKSRFNPQSVTLVFAAPFMGSPSSMFGHTFLRIDSAPLPGHSEKNDLLDYGISYDAVTGPDSGIGYALKGLIGAFPGFFSQQAYFLKINMYSNVDSRDLWEYQLSLTSDEIDRLLTHAWETGMTYFNYYFLNRNCSYQLLSLLEIAHPQWDLRSRFTVMTVPLDTIRALRSYDGAIKKVKFRRSVLGTLNKTLLAMNEKEKSDFFKLKDSVQDVSSDQSALTLDALLDWQKYHAMSESRILNDPEKVIERKLLVLRSKVDSSQEMNLHEDVPSSPELGHKTSKISLGFGSENGNIFSSLEHRGAIHDILDPSDGYLPHSQLILLKTVAEYKISTPSRFRLQELTLAQVTNLAPSTVLRRQWAWGTDGGFYRPMDTFCEDCIAGRFRGGFGKSFLVFPKSDNGLIYGLLKGQAEIGGVFPLGYRVGPSFEAGLILQLPARLRMQWTGEYLRYFPDNASGSLIFFQGSGALAYSVTDFDFRLAGLSTVFSDGRQISRFLFTAGHYF